MNKNLKKIYVFKELYIRGKFNLKNFNKSQLKNKNVKCKIDNKIIYLKVLKETSIIIFKKQNYLQKKKNYAPKWI